MWILSVWFLKKNGSVCFFLSYLEEQLPFVFTENGRHNSFNNFMSFVYSICPWKSITKRSESKDLCFLLCDLFVKDPSFLFFLYAVCCPFTVQMLVKKKTKTKLPAIRKK